MLRRPPEKEALPILGRRSPKDISWNIREGDLLIYSIGPHEKKGLRKGRDERQRAEKKNLPMPPSSSSGEGFYPRCRE